MKTPWQEENMTLPQWLKNKQDEASDLNHKAYKIKKALKSPIPNVLGDWLFYSQFQYEKKSLRVSGFLKEGLTTEAALNVHPVVFEIKDDRFELVSAGEYFEKWKEAKAELDNWAEEAKAWG